MCSVSSDNDVAECSAWFLDLPQVIIICNLHWILSPFTSKFLHRSFLFEPPLNSNKYKHDRHHRESYCEHFGWVSAYSCSACYYSHYSYFAQRGVEFHPELSTITTYSWTKVKAVPLFGRSDLFLVFLVDPSRKVVLDQLHRTRIQKVRLWMAA
jgi:hypothetical protein